MYLVKLHSKNNSLLPLLWTLLGHLCFSSHLLPVRANEQDKVICLVSVYNIPMCTLFIVI